MMTVNEFSKKQLVFVFLNFGDKVSFSNDNLIVKDEKGKTKLQTTCYRIFALFLVGNITITSGIIQKSHKFNFPIVLMNHSLKVYSVIGWKMEGNFLLREKQYAYYQMDIAKHLIKNKLSNEIFLLNQQRKKSDDVKKAILDIKNYISDIDSSDDFYKLLSYEGNAAKVYFKNHFNDIEWAGRKPRGKFDYINSTLDIGYSLLFNIVDTMLCLYGFDTYHGVLHKQFYMRKSLVCDLVEPFRCLIDHKVKKAIHLGQIKKEDFIVVNHKYQLDWKQNKKYISLLLEPILYYKEDIFLYFQSYYRAFMKMKNAKDFPVFRMEKLI